MKKLLIITLFLFASNILLFSQFGGGGPGITKDNAYEIYNTSHVSELKDSLSKPLKWPSFTPTEIYDKHFKITEDFIYSGTPHALFENYLICHIHGGGHTIMCSYPNTFFLP